MATDIERGGRRAPPANDWHPGSIHLRDVWFPIAHLSDLGPQPIRRLVHSQPYFLWLEGERVRAAEFHPARLAANRADASELTGGTGEYPVELAYGLVWAWYGDPSRADPTFIPDVPFIPRDKAVAPHLRGSFYYGATHELIGENVLDLTHINFIHRKAAGFDEAESDEVSVEATSETLTMIRNIKRQPVPEFQRKLAGVDAEFQDCRSVVHVFLRSGICMLNVAFTPGTSSMPLLMGIVPESRTRTLLNFAYGPSDTTPRTFSEEWPKHAPVVMEQDDSMLVPQNPRYFKADNHVDRHTRFDAAGVRFRFLINELAARQAAGDFTYRADIHDAPSVAETLGLRGDYSAVGGASMSSVLQVQGAAA